MPVPVAAQSKAWVCGRSPAEIWVWIQPGSWMFVCWVLCVVRLRFLRRADHSSRGVLLTVAHRCVWSRNFVNEEALAHWGLLHQKQTNSSYASKVTHVCSGCISVHLSPFSDHNMPLSPTNIGICTKYTYLCKHKYCIRKVCILKTPKIESK